MPMKRQLQQLCQLFVVVAVAAVVVVAGASASYVSTASLDNLSVL